MVDGIGSAMFLLDLHPSPPSQLSAQHGVGYGGVDGGSQRGRVGERRQGAQLTEDLRQLFDGGGRHWQPGRQAFVGLQEREILLLFTAEIRVGGHSDDGSDELPRHISESDGATKVHPDPEARGLFLQGDPFGIVVDGLQLSEPFDEDCSG